MAEELTKIQRKANRLKELELDAQTYLSECREITEYILPQKGIYIKDGQKPHKIQNRFAKIIAPVASEDNDLLSAGIQGGLSSQSRPWFKVEAADKALMKFEPVALWCEYVQDQMYSVLAASNFYTTIHDFYNDEGGFGNAVMMAEPDLESVVRFNLLTPGTYYFAESKTGRIDTLYRHFPMRAINVKDQWKGNVSDEVNNLAKNSPFAWVDIVHAIEPNPNRNPNKIDYLNMPFTSCYWEHKKTEKFLSQGGYIELPFMTGRWKINGVEAYATGPGHTALGLTKMLQSMTKTGLKAMHKGADPPVRVPTALKDVLNTLPGGVNATASNDPREAISKLYDLDFDHAGVAGWIEIVVDWIHTIFKRDLFLLITDRPEMTATEVVERSQEKLIMIGPVTERQIPDVLDPALSRVFNIMNRFGMIPPPPFELQGQPLKLDYVSLLAQAQKMMGLQGMRSYLDVAARVAEVSQIPGPANAKTDFDVFLDEYASGLSIPASITRPSDQADEIRQLQQENQQLMEQIEMLKGASETARNLSQADTSSDNALTALTGKAE